jgi:uncharacterized protein YchJ
VRETPDTNMPWRYATASDAGGPWNLWFRLCDAPRCACRDVLVLATREDRDLLEPVAGRVEEAWKSRGRPNERAAGLTGVGGPILGFSLDLDAPAARPLRDAELDPRATGAAESITGDVLDDLHRRWLISKGHAPPPPATEWEARWKRGDLVAWGEVHPGDRGDVYVRNDVDYLCDELYCIVPDCSCDDVVVSFADLEVEKEVGWTSVDHRTGIVSETRGRPDLWASYVARNPRWRERAAARQAALRTIGRRLELARAPVQKAPASPVARRKVGRNEDCPCGSGRKYKKCCGAAT